jgi:16S rRNA (cytosine1402-N4)-methyltransferase
VTRAASTPESHLPVMLAEVLDALAITPDGCYLDGTFGRGGHSAAILARMGPAGRLIALDRDPAAIDSRPDLVADARLERIHARFGDAGALLAARGLAGRLQGALLDLGVSSPQLDDPERGFSFRADGPLDMRMDPSRGQPVSAWLATASEREISDCLWQYGEERHSRRIAARICRQREVEPLTTTGQLAALVAAVNRGGAQRIDPATRTFQALRIFINEELEQLQCALRELTAALAVAGRLVVISFHSLEDRIVKRFFRDLAQARDAAGPVEATSRFQLVFRRSLTANEAEIARNPRARSARLRALERVA